MYSNSRSNYKCGTAFFNIVEEDILNNEKIKVVVLESDIDLYNDIATAMVNKLKENNAKGEITSFILPVGPRGHYKRFARMCNAERINCKNLVTINMDEYLDDDRSIIPLNHPMSFHSYMKENLFELLDPSLGFSYENCYFADPDDLLKIERVIRELSKIDI